MIVVLTNSVFTLVISFLARLTSVAWPWNRAIGCKLKRETWLVFGKDNRRHKINWLILLNGWDQTCLIIIVDDGKAERLPFAPAAKSKAASPQALPTQRVKIGGLMYLYQNYLAKFINTNFLQGLLQVEKKLYNKEMICIFFGGGVLQWWVSIIIPLLNIWHYVQLSTWKLTIDIDIIFLTCMGRMWIQNTNKIEKEGEQYASAKSPPNNMSTAQQDYDRRK